MSTNKTTSQESSTSHIVHTVVVDNSSNNNNNNNSSSSVSELLSEENQQNSSSTTTANTTATVKKKRKQVKKACLNCRKSHSACGNERPCNRCKELGITDTCQDVENKKRGRKQKSNDMVDNNNNNTQNTVKTFVFVDGMNPKSNLTTTTTTNKTTNNNNLMFINHQLPVTPQTLTTTTNNNLTTTAKKVKLNSNTQSEIVQQQQQQQGSNIQNVVPQNSSVPFQSINNNNNNYGDNINNFVSTNDISTANIIPKNITTPLTMANVNNNVLDLNNNIIPPPQIYNNTNLNVNFDTSNLIELLMRQNNFNQSNNVSSVGGVNGSTFTPNLGIPTDNLTSNVLNNFLNGRQQSMYNINNNHIPQPFSMPQHGFHTFNDTNGGENVNYSIPPPTIENQQNYCISNNYEDPYLTIAKLKAENEALKTKYENLYRTSEDFTKTLLGQDKGSGRGVIVSSNRGNIIMMNKVMFDTLGHSYDAIEKGIIQGWKDIIHPTCVSRVFGNLMSKVMNKVNGFCDSYLLQKRNGGIVQSTSSHFVSYDNKTNEALFSVSFLVLSEVPMISDHVGSIIIDNDSHDKPPTLPFMQQEIPSANNINRTNTSIVDNLLMNMNATHKTNNSSAPPSSPPIEEFNSEIAQRVLELLNTISNK
ncbi:hypothetical protein ABK040_005651 [Willaertia magna]